MTPEEIIKQLGIPTEPDFNGCEACKIEHKDLQVKQMPRHTCGKDGPNPSIDTEKRQPSQEQTTYSQEVRRIAEILARTPYNPEKWNDIEWFGSGVKETLIDAKMPEARAMVAEMAKSFRSGYRCGISFCNAKVSDEPEKDLTKTALLIERGLIPSPSTQPDSDTGEN